MECTGKIVPDSAFHLEGSSITDGMVYLIGGS